MYYYKLNIFFKNTILVPTASCLDGLCCLLIWSYHSYCFWLFDGLLVYI